VTLRNLAGKALEFLVPAAAWVAFAWLKRIASKRTRTAPPAPSSDPPAGDAGPPKT